MIVELLAVGVLALVLVFALMAPLESLRWWTRGKGAQMLGTLVRPEPGPETAAEPPPRAFAVYLSGIGAVDGTTDSRRERATLADLAAALPDVVIAADVFPYAVENRGLTQRASRWFWNVLAKLQRIPVLNVLSYVINMRNALRVLVSADPRYGPTFNLAVAQQIVDSLTRHGYDWRARPPVYIIGYSGGGQVALGATPYLDAIGVPVWLISIAGVFGSDPGLDRIQHVWHFYGSRDRTHQLGVIAFPGRWPTAPTSAWHQAVNDGRVTQRCIGPMRHTDGKDYFDRHRFDENGVSFRALTLDAMTEVLQAQPTTQPR